jgi:iron(II)-dependent oxidoreductase
MSGRRTVAGALACLALGAGAGGAATEGMVRIPGGTYILGSDAAADARPVHQVVLKPFAIDRHEVTNAQFAEFLGTLHVRPLRDRGPGMLRPGDVAGPDAFRLHEGGRDPRTPPYVALDDDESRLVVAGRRFGVMGGFERHPVNEVTWAGALAFCRWRGARLPTEAEWEAAARGREARTYPWGHAPPTPERAVYGRGSNNTAPVGSHPAGATPEGVHDLAGNVAEWTSTRYRPYPYVATDGREDPDAAGERVTRGGDHVYDSAPEKLTGFFRAGFSRAVDAGHRHIGIRCARSL